MNVIKTVVCAAALAVLGACGGGGDPGACKFGDCNADATTAVSSGVPSQSKMSFAVDNYALDWTDFAAKAKITVRVADTAGNPVPSGTKVYFVAEAGTVVSSCSLLGKVTSGGESISECSVDFSPLSNLPLDGYATVLVYMEGEEAYVDLNGDHKYTAGETFYDSGALFRDDNYSLAYEAGSDNFVLSGPGAGTSACVPVTGIFTRDSVTPFSVPGTCDGKWGKSYVRASIKFPVAYAAGVGVDDGGVDLNGVHYAEVYSLAVGSRTIHVAPVSGTTMSIASSSGACTLALSETTVPVNQVDPMLITILQTGTCSGVTATVTAVSGGTTAVKSFTL